MAVRVDEADAPGPTVEQLLRDHGSEIYGWLAATLSSDTDADDAFSLFSEDLWKSLARYRRQCSPRTWCYMLARAAASRLHEARRARQALPISEAPVAALVAHIRETTRLHLQTGIKERVRSARAQLEPEDQTLLILRVDRDLGWRDIAYIMLGPDARDAELARHAAVLRKRFERAKLRLRTLVAATAHPDQR
jgi:RNA polymerase sigma-70 factor (ECF subfamily)